VLTQIAHGHSVYAAAFDAFGALFVTALDDKTAAVWDATIGINMTTVRHEHAIYNAFEISGTRFVLQGTALVFGMHLLGPSSQ
jgi:WD40 repeat protein